MGLNIVGVGKCIPKEYEGNKIPYKEYMPKSINQLTQAFNQYFKSIVPHLCVYL